MNIFEYRDYRDLVSAALQKKLGRGAKVKLADYLNCKPGYVSQVLGKSKIHFSSENVLKIASFLDFNAVGEEYLLTLLQLERAGSRELQRYYEKKIEAFRKEHLRVEKQISPVNQELSESDKAIYYSHWAYSAIHMLVSIPKYQTEETISERLRIGRGFTNKVLKFLDDRGLVLKKNNRFSIGKTRIHLKSDSPLIKSHHQNFRNKSILSLEEENEFDLHYSSVLTLSVKDSVKIRELLLKFLKEKEEILIPSPNEEAICLNLDLMRL